MKNVLKISVAIVCLYLIYLGSVALIHHHHFLSGMMIITITIGVIILAIAFGLARIIVAFISREKKVSPKEKEVKPPMSITIDGDTILDLPPELSITGRGAEHRKMGKITLEKRTDGKLYVNGVEVIRYISPEQERDHIEGKELRKQMKDKKVLNACVMDTLFSNNQLIPDEWKIGYIFSWGTIFRKMDGCLYIEYMRWNVHSFIRGYLCLNYSWSKKDSAIILSS